MRSHRSTIDHILRRQVVVSRRENPELSHALSRLVTAGELLAVLPGVYAAPPATDFAVRVHAVMSWDRDAVLTGRAAARAWFWPKLSCPVLEVAVRRRLRVTARPGFCFVERPIPPELVVTWNGVRMTVPALTAVDLCEELGGEAIDVALRTRTARLVDLERALELTPGRPGNLTRRALVLDSRDEPWSPPERKLHRLLRAAGITGWRANLRVRGPGWVAYLDVGFEGERLDVEVDGREHHIDRAAFDHDRIRQNRLVLDGWMVLRFTPAMIDDDPARVIDTILEGLAACRGGAVGRRSQASPARRRDGS